LVEKSALARRHSALNRAIASMQYIATMQYMNARAIVQAKEIRDEGSIVEIVIWELAAPLPPCRHNVENWRIA
jgi:hypothetical protein